MDPSSLELSPDAMSLLMAWGLPILFLHLVHYVVENTPESQARRDVTVADCFAGKAAISRAFRARRRRAATLDIEIDNSHDLLTVPGFCKFIQVCLRLIPLGAMICGPPCGSYVWVNRHTSRRSKKRPLGDCSKLYVRQNNTICSRLVMLAFLATCRTAYVAVEQPSSSLMPWMYYWIWMAQKIRPLKWHHCRFPMAAYGSRTRKPSLMFGTAPWIMSLKKKLTEKDKRRVAANKMRKKYRTTTKKIRQNGTVSVTGSTGLKASAEYPDGFGKAIATNHLDLMATKDHTAFRQWAPAAKSKPAKVPAAGPYRWRHAQLVEIQKFLRDEYKEGRYHPTLPICSLFSQTTA